MKKKSESKTKRKYILIQYGINFLIIFAIMIGIITGLSYVGFSAQALTTECETAYSEAQEITETIEIIRNHEQLLKVWLEHPETLTSEYWQQNSDILDLIDQSDSDFDASMLSPEKEGTRAQLFYASLLFDNFTDSFNYAHDLEPASLDGPFLLAKIDEGQYQVCIDSSAKHLALGEIVAVVSSHEIQSSEDDDLSPAINNTVAIAEQNGETLAAVVYPIKSDEKIVGLVAITIEKNFIARTNFKLASTILSFMIIMAILLGIVLLLRLYHMIVKPLSKVQKGLENYTNDLDTIKLVSQMKSITSTNEIGILAKNIETMVKKIHSYTVETTALAAEKSKIESELSLASNIQSSRLPTNFPDSSIEKRVEIFASMAPAKEVGGDLYDFFFIDDDHLAFVIADVSGKGIPAALFMMEAKTIIKDKSSLGKSPAVILSEVNAQLLEHNKEKLFITTWLLIIELSTGIAVEANAGHEKPTLCHLDGKFELIKNKHSLALGLSKKITIKDNEWQLTPGDKIFVYTDGVTEATNENEELFGSERLIDTLNQVTDKNPKEIIEHVKSSIDEFVGTAPQFDDITMLVFTYNGPYNA
ncbi:PP2C family protein-serine/threonine phosphatase [Butyrivibrio sp. YAB3001]|uniref:PP2C family protein-serine/threonine phosphatase n=1 Tax=Butyrivibrio sp. YAB3001 TaxID=1520812 RepID=UPI0008F65EAE|nr:PP2C family protein-serine/threonine phosphatase [Butyrivibrio sp. YAB3001]SFD08980.1 HAMP domain-containing protein [Butyrivibrio sp. YAB3001]